MNFGWRDEIKRFTGEKAGMDEATIGLPEDEQKRWARRGVLYLAQLLKSSGKGGALKSPVGASGSED